MARPQPARRRARGGGGSALDRAASALAGLLSAVNDPANRAAQLTTAEVLLAVEAVLCLLIIRRVPYTEIDWVAYMQEVGGYLEGERDYAKLRGDTGPLVYPAGFVYLFAALQRVTGGSVETAQYIFAALYLATQAAAMALYIRAASLPPWSLALLCASRRLHSIFVLRLFNDCWAMLVAFLATLALQGRRWVLSVVLYSAAVSIKMNVLLMAPGVLAVLIKYATPRDILGGAALGVALQAALGAPFLAAHPRSYVVRAFEFSRVFTYKWSVNWQLLPEPAFLSRQLALALLYLHLRLLWSLAQKSWLRAEGGLWPALRRLLAGGPPPPAPDTSRARRGRAGGAADARKGGTRSDERFADAVLFIVFSSNFAGIAASRTIHYQFYSWYFHTLPFLLLRAPLPRAAALAVLGGVELVYNVYPPRAWASALLLAMHGTVLLATFWHSGPPVPAAAGTPAAGAHTAAGTISHTAGAGEEEAAAAADPGAQRRRRRSRAAVG
ncbi:Dol-P-Man:Man(5) c(2)-PP-Dol alpha-1,3-mannosyltransferase [Micractinium conductrix]|uniref:dolichyl-P-Man:Man5GlcNAc2-PP-dolichol alpha-1,3-mannosyltransferase n=1 Tax=Micractinium conductrix TaxID=554055 RepID=A0A2P6VG64_9CHLO|nr:Dol-P-Man:Man(5) c(2)-PP-Dol alpha-1,3-mannosyltransferase [Micractinium conductrix]|eukprot:PSC73067.1 Dol-P-Man:Man(5) c(2)-PP-Dol alpha-1,3-mannosyltransferase [Micractinium conductrix]